MQWLIPSLDRCVLRLIESKVLDATGIVEETGWGGGGILQTLPHIVDVEYSWLILDMGGKQDVQKPSLETPASLQKVKALSSQYRKQVEPFVMSWTNQMESRTLTETGPDGQVETFRFGEIMRHVIAHEIHHTGQLSVWSRELGRKPVTANLIRRGLFER